MPLPPRPGLLTRLRRDTRGSALIELGALLGIFGIPLLIGTGETGLLVFDSIEITNAAHAAAIYAMQSSTTAGNTAGIVAAARADAPDFGTSLAVTSSTYYACATALTGVQFTGATAQTLANAACTGLGNHALQFVQVYTSATVTPSLHFPILPASFTLRGYSVTEVEQ